MFGGWPAKCWPEVVSSGTAGSQTQVMAVSGKHLPSPKHFIQCSVTVKFVRCGLMRNCWPREDSTGKRRETVPCPDMLTEVFRRLQESKVEPTKMVFEEALKIVKAKVKLVRSIPTQELNTEFTPAPRPGWKTHPMKKHTGAV